MSHHQCYLNSLFPMSQANGYWHQHTSASSSPLKNRWRIRPLTGDVKENVWLYICTENLVRDINYPKRNYMYPQFPCERSSQVTTTVCVEIVDNTTSQPSNSLQNFAALTATVDQEIFVVKNISSASSKLKI